VGKVKNLAGSTDHVRNSRHTVLTLINIVAVLIFIVTLLIAYDRLPDDVALGFNWEGLPRSYGPKEQLLYILIFPMIATTVSVAALINGLTLLRHTLVSKYPYLINIPALSLLLGSERLTDEERRHYIDKMFIVMPLVSLYVIGLIGWTTYATLEAGRTGQMLSGPLLLAATLGSTVVLIVPMLLYYRRIYHSIKKLLDQRR